MSGKGSKRRPVQDPDKFASEWDRIFSGSVPDASTRIIPHTHKVNLDGMLSGKDREDAELDLAIYGSCCIIAYADGSVRRVDPMSMRAFRETDGGEKGSTGPKA